MRRKNNDMKEQLGIVQKALGEEQREKAHLREKMTQLQRDCNSKDREKVALEQRVTDLQELLTDCDAALTETRMMLQESEEVLRIQSSDIEVTEKKLGSGSFGGVMMSVWGFGINYNCQYFTFSLEVRIAYWRGCAVAVKMLYEVLAGSQHNIDLLLQEVSIAWKIHHPNIASVCGVTLELKDRKKTAWIIMELLQGSMAGLIDESRRDGVGQLTVREKVDMSRDCLCGLHHLHCLVSNWVFFAT